MKEICYEMMIRYNCVYIQSYWFGLYSITFNHYITQFASLIINVFLTVAEGYVSIGLFIIRLHGRHFYSVIDRPAFSDSRQYDGAPRHHQRPGENEHLPGSCP